MDAYLPASNVIIIGNRRFILAEEKTQSKEPKAALYLEDDTPVCTIEVTDFGDEVIAPYLHGYFEHAAGVVSDISIVTKQQDGKEIRTAYVTFVVPEDAAKLICDPSLKLNCKFTVKQAESAYQQKRNPNSFKFEQLNDDCLRKIASYLDVLDVVNLGKSCTRLQSFSQLIFQQKRHFKVGFGTSGSSLNDTNLELMLHEMGTYIKSIDWSNLRLNDLTLISKNCSNVNELHLYAPQHILHLHVVQGMKQFFNDLQKLHIRYSALFDGSLKMITSGSQIKSLHLEHCYNIRGKFLSKWRHCQLQELKITECPKIEQNELCSLVGSIKLTKFAFGKPFLKEYLTLPSNCLEQLEELDLNFASSDSAIRFDQLNFLHLQRLTHLTLNVYESYGNCNTLLDAIGQINTLESLSISGLQANGDTLNRFGLMKNLRKLRLDRFCNRIGSDFFQSLHRHLPDINSLEFSHYALNNSVPPQYICTMISSLAVLKHFSYDYTNFALLDMIVKLQLKWKRPTIEIGVPTNYLSEEMRNLSVASGGAVKLMQLPCVVYETIDL